MQSGNSMQETGSSRQSNRLINSSQRISGFTLIELLTVITIFAVIAGFTTMAVRNDPHRILENSAKRFVDQFTLISEEAALHGLDYGLRIEKTDYAYRLWDNLQWRAPKDEYLATRTTFPPELDVELILEPGSELILDSESDPDKQGLDKEYEEPPQILLLSSGEITPFSLLIRSVFSDDYLEIKFDALGRASVERHNAG
jgi:general secretion pathway protein H